MITVKDVEEFISFLKSGEMERTFLQSTEQKKGELLELLEKIMDAGEAADEAATRIIFRSLPSGKDR